MGIMLGFFFAALIHCLRYPVYIFMLYWFSSYSGESVVQALSFLYTLSLNSINLITSVVIQGDSLCLYLLTWSSGRQDATYQMATSVHNELMWRFLKTCYYVMICLCVETQYDNNGTVLSENDWVIIMNTNTSHYNGGIRRMWWASFTSLCGEISIYLYYQLCVFAVNLNKNPLNKLSSGRWI